MKLILRQTIILGSTILFFVLLAYIKYSYKPRLNIEFEWQHKYVKPSESVHENSRNENIINQELFTDIKYLNSDKNVFENWIEPVTFDAINTTTVNSCKSHDSMKFIPENAEGSCVGEDIGNGLYYIAKHSHFLRESDFQKESGLIKVFKFNMDTSPNDGNDISKEMGEHKKSIKKHWEFLFADRIPGVVIHSHLDRTRDIKRAGITGSRKLGFLYSIVDNKNETIKYYIRVYNMETLVSMVPEQEFKDITKIEDDQNISGSFVKDDGAQNINNDKRLRTLAFDKNVCIYNQKMLDKDKDDKKNESGGGISNALFYDSRFTSCVGERNRRFLYVDYELPGSLPVTKFSIRNDMVVYIRNEDEYMFRMAKVETDENSKKKDTQSPSGNFASTASLSSSRGPLLDRRLSQIYPQSNINIMRSGKKILEGDKQNGENVRMVDLMVPEGWIQDNKFKFKLTFIQNRTVVYDKLTGNKLLPPILEKESRSKKKNGDLQTDKDFDLESEYNFNIEGQWVLNKTAQYYLSVGRNYNGLSAGELKLIQRPPATQQTSNTLAIYFYLSKVLLTVDTVVDGNERTVHRLTTKLVDSDVGVNDSEITNMALDDSGNHLVLVKANGNLMVYTRTLSSTNQSPNPEQKNTKEKLPHNKLDSLNNLLNAHSLLIRTSNTTLSSPSPYEWVLSAELTTVNASPLSLSLSSSLSDYYIENPDYVSPFDSDFIFPNAHLLSSVQQQQSNIRAMGTLSPNYGTFFNYFIALRVVTYKQPVANTPPMSNSPSEFAYTTKIYGLKFDGTLVSYKLTKTNTDSTPKTAATHDNNDKSRGKNDDAPIFTLIPPFFSSLALSLVSRVSTMQFTWFYTFLYDNLELVVVFAFATCWFLIYESKV